uniref:DUF1618 domain-containing protein n=1 Tax=Oryza meridionalis TaxID=40149 RepID=A0A0E0CTZ6_9ORYZ
MASESTDWRILATIARVCAADADLPSGPGGADLSLALAAPPGISVLTVPPRVCPDPLTQDNHPSVLVADPSGLLLLHATQGKGTSVDGGPVVREYVDGYFVCDTRSATVSRLPVPDTQSKNRILDAGNLGFLTQDGGRTYMVAELQPIVGSDKAVLLCYSSETGRWVDKILDYPLREVRPWASHGVVSSNLHQRLWWFDVSWGILTCLPMEENPRLQFVPLPACKKIGYHCNQEDLQRFRCITVSNGAVRFVEIGVPAKPKVIVNRLRKMVLRHGKGHHPWVAMYTLYHDDESDSWLWRIEHEFCFRDVWSHNTYEATGLPKKVPKLACVDPYNPDVVYFFIDRYVFGVDLCCASVHKCARYKLENPPRRFMSSRFVLAF